MNFTNSGLLLIGVLVTVMLVEVNSQANETTNDITSFKIGLTGHGEGFLVRLLNAENETVSAGALITWKKVITTCSAILSGKVEYASFRTNDKVNGWRKKVKNLETDQRCNKHRAISKFLRYNVGVVELEGPAEANYVTRVLQYPSLSKQKYLRLSDQVINRRLNCSVYLFTTKSGWSKTRIQMMPSHETAQCEEFTGIHEFVCAVSQEIPNEVIFLNQGSPVICGEDAYGILTAPEDPDALGTKDLVLMRLDECIHLIVHPKLIFDYYS